MCGIVAYSGKDNFSASDIKILLMFNQERGDKGTGMWTGTKVIKDSISAKEFISKHPIEERTIFLGHTRNPSYPKYSSAKDSHPFENEHIVGVHNGTISNIRQLASYYEVDVDKMDVDSEILMALLAKTRNESFSVLKHIEGTASIVWIDKSKGNELYCYRKNDDRPLLRGYIKGNMYLSSEEDSLKTIGCTGINSFKTKRIFRIKSGKIESNYGIKEENGFIAREMSKKRDAERKQTQQSIPFANETFNEYENWQEEKEESRIYQAHSSEFKKYTEGNKKRYPENEGVRVNIRRNNEIFNRTVNTKEGEYIEVDGLRGYVSEWVILAEKKDRPRYAILESITEDAVKVVFGPDSDSDSSELIEKDEIVKVLKLKVNGFAAIHTSSHKLSAGDVVFVTDIQGMFADVENDSAPDKPTVTHNVQSRYLRPLEFEEAQAIVSKIVKKEVSTRIDTIVRKEQDTKIIDLQNRNYVEDNDVDAVLKYIKREEFEELAQTLNEQVEILPVALRRVQESIGFLKLFTINGDSRDTMADLIGALSSSASKLQEITTKTLSSTHMIKKIKERAMV